MTETAAQPNETTDQPAGRAIKPPVSRWLLAGVAAWLVAPISAPFLWAFLFAEGLDPGGFLFALFFAYVIGLPISAPCVVALGVICFLGFQRIADRPAFAWGAIGAGLGLVAILITLAGGFDLSDGGAPEIALFLSGPVPGFIAALVFRKVLMKNAQA